MHARSSLSRRLHLKKLFESVPWAKSHGLVALNLKLEYWTAPRRKDKSFSSKEIREGGMGLKSDQERQGWTPGIENDQKATEACQSLRIQLLYQIWYKEVSK